MSANLDKLRRLLAELFQLDQADLDFGIYRIMNAKRDEITRFLESELLPQVKEAFQHYRSADKAALQEELDKTIEGARAAGFDPELSPKVKELREKLAAAVDVTALENEVFSDLCNFFRRYYNEGDFLSLRRYKEGVYAIPYEGEEVKLHWANADQYYIKTTEYFRDYTFKLPSGKRVHFKLAEADTERDNNQTQAGNDRRFILSETDPLLEQDGDLIIRFEYHPDSAGRKQKELNDRAVEKILHAPGFGDWQAELAQLRATEKNPKRTLLEKHLTDYTARNTFDYFIHKDLGGFLRRELDFFIKNDIMHLDDIEHESAPRVEQYLSKIKVIRQIAHKIIEFLAQIEDFQKKLWLKKKFVVETNYCVTLDRVSEDFYPEIAANDVQREEWVRLFAVDEITGNLNTPKYSNPLTMDFLKANPYLVLDTKFFGQEFKNKLMARYEDFDGQTDGVIIQSENFQALNLIMECYSEKIRCIYIDPPYNSAASEILYKNDYKHSSWNTLIKDRIILSKSLSTDDGIICVTIDDNELRNLSFLLGDIFGYENNLGTALIRNNPQGRSTVKGFAVNHEFALFYACGEDVITVGRLERSDIQIARYNEIDEEGKSYLWENFRKTGSDSMRNDRPKQFYPIFIKGNDFRIPTMQWNDVSKEWIIHEEPQEGERVIYPIDENGTQRVWKWGHGRVIKSPNHIKITLNGNDCQVYRRNYLNILGSLPGTWWDKPKYAAGSHGTNLLTDLFGLGHTFLFPKSVYAVEDCLKVSGADNKSIAILDYFAGSGTTGHAVINLNRIDGGKRKYILVEMGEYFDTVMKPRIQKVIYSKDWKDGKPVSREGSSHMFKYIRLESYEDTLNNLELKRTEAQKSLLDQSAPFKESYMLSYMLDVESRGSASLLNIDAFVDPFNYKMNIATGSVGETRPITVDLVETFNYLLGLTVRHLDHIRSFRVVQGANPQGEKVLVIWRNLKEKSNTDLEEFFRKQEYNPKDLEFDLIYVNGDNNLENLRRPDETWKVRLIEEEFHRLMFQVEDA